MKITKRAKTFRDESCLGDQRCFYNEDFIPEQGHASLGVSRECDFCHSPLLRRLLGAFIWQTRYSLDSSMKFSCII